MKFPIILVSLMLVGCSTPVPVKMKFPNVPSELLEACAKAKLMTGLSGTKIKNLYQIQ